MEVLPRFSNTHFSSVFYKVNLTGHLKSRSATRTANRVYGTAYRIIRMYYNCLNSPRTIITKICESFRYLWHNWWYHHYHFSKLFPFSMMSTPTYLDDLRLKWLSALGEWRHSDRKGPKLVTLSLMNFLEHKENTVLY